MAQVVTICVEIRKGLRAQTKGMDYPWNVTKCHHWNKNCDHTNKMGRLNDSSTQTIKPIM